MAEDTARVLSCTDGCRTKKWTSVWLVANHSPLLHEEYVFEIIIMMAMFVITIMKRNRKNGARMNKMANLG